MPQFGGNGVRMGAPHFTRGPAAVGAHGVVWLGLPRGSPWGRLWLEIPPLDPTALFLSVCGGPPSRDPLSVGPPGPLPAPSGPCRCLYMVWLGAEGCEQPRPRERRGDNDTDPPSGHP